MLALAQGANGVVVEAETVEASVPAGGFPPPCSRLAVKILRARQHGRVHLEAAMWEVHVLRQLRGHENIVQLTDVVEVCRGGSDSRARPTRQNSPRRNPPRQNPPR